MLSTIYSNDMMYIRRRGIGVSSLCRQDRMIWGAEWGQMFDGKGKPWGLGGTLEEGYTDTHTHKCTHIIMLGGKKARVCVA